MNNDDIEKIIITKCSQLGRTEVVMKPNNIIVFIGAEALGIIKSLEAYNKFEESLKKTTLELRGYCER